MYVVMPITHAIELHRSDWDKRGKVTDITNTGGEKHYSREQKVSKYAWRTNFKNLMTRLSTTYSIQNYTFLLRNHEIYFKALNHCFIRKCINNWGNLYCQELRKTVIKLVQIQTLSLVVNRQEFSIVQYKPSSLFIHFQPWPWSSKVKQNPNARVQKWFDTYLA